MEENSSENLQNKKYFRNIDEAIKVYEKFRRFKDKGFIKSIDPDFFFNLTDMFLSDYKRVLEINEVLLKKNEELNKKTKEQKECTFREDGTEECLWHCSNCHDEWLFYEGTPEENNLKYCPHCGAKVIKYESYIETEIEIANKMVKDYLKESEE